MIDLSLLAILGGTAGIGALVAGWRTFKSWLVALQGLFLIRIVLTAGVMTHLVEYLGKHGRLLRVLSPSRIYDTLDYVGSCKAERQFAYRTPDPQHPMWWIYKGHLLQLSGDTLTAARWFPLTALFTKIYEHVNDRRRETGIDNRHYIRPLRGELPSCGGSSSAPGNEKPQALTVTPGGFGYTLAETVCSQFPVHDVGRKDRPIPPLLYIHTPTTSGLFSDLRHWLDSKDWYLERGIPWRRGYLLCGPPGTGKTGFIRSAAEQLGLPIMAIHLSTMSDHDLDSTWDTLRFSSPCLALLEDLDTIFDGRTFMPTRGAFQHTLSFEGLLNKIDGVDHCNGICLFVTSNDVDKIDPALKYRPGRIDRTVQFGNATKDQKEAMAIRIFNGSPRELWEPLLAQDCTMAQFQEDCCKKALELYWKDKA